MVEFPKGRDCKMKYFLLYFLPGNKLFQMQISEPRWNKASYLEAIKYFLPGSTEQSESCSVMSDSVWLNGLYSPWNSPGQNTGVDSLSLLQRIFPTQRSNPALPHYRQILYQLSHKGSQRILEWGAYPISRESSWHRNQAGVSCIAGGFFTNWAIREKPWMSCIIHKDDP